jgi:hypothetical protein
VPRQFIFYSKKYESYDEEAKYLVNNYLNNEYRNVSKHFGILPEEFSERIQNDDEETFKMLYVTYIYNEFNMKIFENKLPDLRINIINGKKRSKDAGIFLHINKGNFIYFKKNESICIIIFLILRYIPKF